MRVEYDFSLYFASEDERDAKLNLVVQGLTKAFGTPSAGELGVEKIPTFTFIQESFRDPPPPNHIGIEEINFTAFFHKSYACGGSPKDCTIYFIITGWMASYSTDPIDDMVERLTVISRAFTTFQNWAESL